MRTFVAIVAVAVTLAYVSATPLPQAGSPAAVAVENNETVASDAKPGDSGVKQNPVSDAFNTAVNSVGQFFSNIQLPNVFAAPSPAGDAAAAPAAGGNNPIESALTNVATFVQDRWSDLTNALTPTTAAPVKTSDTASPAPVAAAVPAATVAEKETA